MNTGSHLALAGALALTGLSAQDHEQATHADSASTPQIAFETKGDGWSLRQYQLGCLSHLSYLLVAGKEAAVVDPQRDVDHYLRDAAAQGATVTWVLLTHPHADFVAGHTELAHRTGAKIAISRAANAGFAHQPLGDGDRVQVGTTSFEAWATPGHTPNAMTFLLRVPGAAADPAFALTGDTLFIGSIGRPDLLDVPPAELAAKSFASVQRLKTLPDATLVLPAHGAGSLCGAHLSPETTSTIGAEKATNPYLKIGSQATFVANVISHQPVAPRYFGFNVELNRKGPPLVERAATLPNPLDGAAVRTALADGGWIVDLRDQAAYARSHVEGAINVALRGRLDTWTGIVVPFTAKLLLVGSDDEVREGAFRLRRIGFDTIHGRLAADPDAWRRDGLPVRTSRVVTPKELHAAMQTGTEPMVVDVRSADEFADLRLGDVGNIPVTESERFAAVLAKDAPVLMVCNSAYRSSMAVGLAERLGFRDVASLDGGMDAWLAAGLPVVGRMAKAGASPKSAAATAPAAGDKLALPEPIEPGALAKVLLEQPGSYTVLDLRPQWQFAEWTLPGARNVAADGVLDVLASLPAEQRVVLVDRDGTHAFAVAGAVMARTPERLLRVLLGGAIGYHRTTTFGGTAAMAGGARAPVPASTPVPVPTTPPAPAAKKRSAGC
ncbi:MAG: MBL fold metallo-hydrolase [Planctomycetes bacterium]|nr:MBL fold metallo-hydrolase [Planctomycetota bacterium]